MPLPRASLFALGTAAAAAGTLCACNVVLGAGEERADLRVLVQLRPLQRRFPVDVPDRDVRACIFIRLEYIDVGGAFEEHWRTVPVNHSEKKEAKPALRRGTVDTDWPRQPSPSSTTTQTTVVPPKFCVKTTNRSCQRRLTIQQQPQ